MLLTTAEARVITAPDGTEINLLAVIPLHRDEVAVKIEQGTDALIEVLDRGRVTELLETQIAETDYRLKKQARNFLDFLASVQEIRRGASSARTKSGR